MFGCIRKCAQQITLFYRERETNTSYRNTQKPVFLQEIFRAFHNLALIRKCVIMSISCKAKRQIRGYSNFQSLKLVCS